MTVQTVFGENLLDALFDAARDVGYPVRIRVHNGRDFHIAHAPEIDTPSNRDGGPVHDNRPAFQARVLEAVTRWDVDDFVTRSRFPRSGLYTLQVHASLAP